MRRLLDLLLDEDSGPKIGLLVFGLAVVLVALKGVHWFFVEVPGEINKRIDIGYEATTSTNIVQIEIGNHAFAIPRAYIWYRPNWKGGKQDGLLMEALLPDFERRTSENRSEFETPGWDREVKINLHHRPAFSTKRLFLNLRSNDYIVSKPTPEYEEGWQYFRENRGNRKEYFVRQSDDGRYHVMACFLPDIVPFPSCKAEFDFAKDLTGSFSFDRERLKSWEELEAKVIRLLRSFEVQATRPE